MAEIVFPCNCGMILKVYGDEQVGQGIVCPSCNSTVIVPASSVAVEAAPIVSDRPVSKTGKWLGLAYLGGIIAVTLGLIKFILIPALTPPVAPARVDAASEEAPEDTAKTAEREDAPRRLLKKPRSRATSESDDPEVESPKVAVIPKSASPSARRGPAPRKGTPKSARPPRWYRPSRPSKSRRKFHHINCDPGPPHRLPAGLSRSTRGTKLAPSTGSLSTGPKCVEADFISTARDRT